MFEAVNRSPYPGISYTTTLPIHIPNDDSDDVYKATIEQKVQGYLDDTTWVSENIDSLQQNLTIADEFYKLANIKINKTKTLILSNDKKI